MAIITLISFTAGPCITLLLREKRSGSANGRSFDKNGNGLMHSALSATPNVTVSKSVTRGEVLKMSCQYNFVFELRQTNTARSAR